MKLDSKKRVEVNDHFQTNIPSIYAVCRELRERERERERKGEGEGNVERWSAERG